MLAALPLEAGAAAGAEEESELEDAAGLDSLEEDPDEDEVEVEPLDDPPVFFP